MLIDPDALPNELVLKLYRSVSIDPVITMPLPDTNSDPVIIALPLNGNAAPPPPPDAFRANDAVVANDADGTLPLIALAGILADRINVPDSLVCDTIVSGVYCIYCIHIISLY
jgi:hypothetical protein